MRAVPVLFVVAAALACAEPDRSVDARSTRHFARHAMGVRFEIELVPDASLEPAGVVERAFEEVERIERLLSSWSPESAVSRWNRASREGAAGPIALDDEVAALVERALAFSAESAGAFDPTVGSLLRELGFYGDPPATDLEAGPQRWRDRVGAARLAVEHDGDGATVERDVQGIELDLSGLAKGYAAERVRDVLVAAGVPTARVVAGSTVLAFGRGPGGRGWSLELPRPDGPVVWWLTDESVSTSGQTSITLPGALGAKSHILDPRTLRPVDHRTEMVVVRTRSGLQSDMLATALLVLGIDEGRAWLAARRDAADADAVVAVFYAAPATGAEERGPEILRVESPAPPSRE